MTILSLENATESVLFRLLTEDHDWRQLITRLEDIAKKRPRQPGMESHHIEPLREEVISLWPLEHLAVHICHAKLEPSDSCNAKVAAFVKSFPGSYRRLLKLSEPLLSKVLALGQSRPSNKGPGKLQHIHKEKDERGRSLAAIKASKASGLKRRIPVKVTNLITEQITVYSSVKEAAQKTGIHRQNLSSYLTGYISYLPRSVQGKYSYEVAL